MSHIEEGKTILAFPTLAAALRDKHSLVPEQHPCLALLRQALLMVAQEYGGSVGPTYADFRYHPQKTNSNLALTIPDRLPRGIGLDIDEQTGALSFKGDPWNHRAFFNEVQSVIVQKYVVLAHAAALRRMHARVTTRVVDHQVVIEGVFHG